nr:hypothetical protein 11 [Spirochaetaceae bacterium]
MPAQKKYSDAAKYERKLDRVMDRLGIGDDFNFGRDRYGGWVEFNYNGQPHRFEYTVEKAQAKGFDLVYGSDAFAQLVLGLEDLARLVERGIYDLGTWIVGMRFLPAPVEIPECFRILGFQVMPNTAEEVRARYKTLVKQYHPDRGGSANDLARIKTAEEQALKHMEAVR